MRLHLLYSTGFTGHGPRPARPALGPGHVARGYTLAEMLIVVVIVGLIGSLAIPQAVGLRTPRLRTAASVLAADLEFCQSQNINDTAAHYVMVFNVPNQTYLMALSTTPTVPISHPGDAQPFLNDFTTGRNSGLTGVTLQKVTNVPTTNGRVTLSYDCFGKPQISQNATFTLLADGNTMTLTLDASTGDITIGAPTAVTPD